MLMRRSCGAKEVAERRVEGGGAAAQVCRRGGQGRGYGGMENGIMRFPRAPEKGFK